MISVHILHPESRIHTRKFLHLSYPSQTDRTYLQGLDDIYFILAWTINFTALRAISIEWILRPLAKYLGVAKKSHLRFAEQGWLALYYGTFWTLGMVCKLCTPNIPLQNQFDEWYLQENHSISGTIPSTGSTMPRSGRPGLLGRCQALSNGIIWCNWHFGSSRSSSSTLKLAGKIMPRCSPTTSSLAP